MIPGTDLGQLFGVSTAVAGSLSLASGNDNILFTFLPHLTIVIGIITFGSMILTKLLKKIL